MSVEIRNLLLFGPKTEIPIYRERSSKIMAAFSSSKMSFLVIEVFMNVKLGTCLEKVAQLPP